MAQDFHAAFSLGTDERHIATVDADGVALSAIQGLNQKLEETRAENAALKARLEKLEALLNRENGQTK
jgi:cell division protein FtsB